MPGIETSRAAWQIPASATSTSASPSSRSCSGVRSCRAVKNGRVSLMYRPSIAKAASSVSPGRAADPRSGRVATPVHDADSEASCPIVTCPPTTGHAEPLARPRDAVEHALGVLAVGADEHVDERERPAAHGAHVGDVGDHGGRAGAVRVGGQERRRDRLAADHQELAAVLDERGVVAVDAEPLDDPHVALAEQPRRRTDGLGQRLEIRHRRD